MAELKLLISEVFKKKILKLDRDVGYIFIERPEFDITTHLLIELLEEGYCSWKRKEGQWNATYVSISEWTEPLEINSSVLWILRYM